MCSKTSVGGSEIPKIRAMKQGQFFVPYLKILRLNYKKLKYYMLSCLGINLLEPEFYI